MSNINNSNNVDNINTINNVNSINTIRLRNLRQQCFRLKRRRAGLREPSFVRKSEKNG
jgi:hypothetical protein